MSDSESSFKQRIIGALVLVALAVIVIPMLFQGKDEDPLPSVQVETPPMPDLGEPATFEPEAVIVPQPDLQPVPDEQFTLIELDEPVLITEPEPGLIVQPERPAVSVTPQTAPATVASPRPDPAPVVKPAAKPVVEKPVEKPVAPPPAPKPAPVQPAKPVEKPVPQPVAPARNAAAEQLAAPPAPANTAAVSPAVPAVAKPVAPGIDSNNLPVSWAIQLGSLGSLDNAITLRDTYRSKHYAAYVRSGGGVHKVFIGPLIREAEAQAMCKQLKNRDGQDCFVVRYQP